MSVLSVEYTYVYRSDEWNLLSDVRNASSSCCDWVQMMMMSSI